MSRIDQLIQELCPNGVPVRSLGDVGELVRGNGLPKTDFQDSGVGAIHYGQIYTYYGTWATETISFVAPDAAARLAKVDPGDVIITNTSENLEDVGKAVAWLGAEQIVTGGHATVLKHHQDPKFIAYWLQSPGFQIQKKKLATGTKVIDVSAKSLAKINIPVPPLEVQREIVKVLETFSDLDLELKAELRARNRQYAHYRDFLIGSLDADVPRLPLGEIATIVRGASPRPIQAFLTDAEDGVPWIKIGDVAAGGKYITTTEERVTPAGAAKSRRVYPGDFVLSNSMSFGRPYISRIEGCIHDGWLAISDFAESFVHDFLYHLLRSAPVQAEFMRRAGTGAVRNLNANIVKSVSVPVPPLNEQERIVSILDKFDLLVNDPESGLPAEIGARRKQYEYYRDKLLTFEELPV
ncbi:restriction endonuclease subunit S [Nocardioides sp. KR10-350]|uniref:restriction endonuclease subunit S n=1 Tax=Nocardioides cheoyonin TaxID=3156615 RepID=UPI0032B37E54